MAIELQANLDALAQIPRVSVEDFTQPVSAAQQFLHDLETERLDAIMLANQRFNREAPERPDMEPINLGIGVIANQETGHAWQPDSVRRAFEDTSKLPTRWGYLPPSGHAGFLRAVHQHWIMGQELWERLGGLDKDVKPSTMVWAQTLGGTKGVRLAAEMYARQRDHGNRTAFLEVPTWPNYAQILLESGFSRVVLFDRKNADGTWYDHELYMEALKALPRGSFVMMQGDGYNGDGIDKSAEQIDEIAATLEGSGHEVLVDTAYDRIAQPRRPGIRNYTLRKLIETSGIGRHSSYSLSKNCGLYGDRVGAWTYLPQDADAGKIEKMQQYVGSRLIRPDESSPIRPPAVAMYHQLSDDDRRHLLEAEITEAERFTAANKDTFAAHLAGHGITSANIDGANGLFAIPLADGFPEGAVDRMIEEHGVYALDNSRLNFGMKGSQIRRVVDVLAGNLR